MDLWRITGQDSNDSDPQTSLTHTESFFLTRALNPSVESDASLLCQWSFYCMLCRRRQTATYELKALSCSEKRKSPSKGAFSGTSRPLKMGLDLHSSHSILLALNLKWDSRGFIYVGSGTKSAARQSLEEFLGGYRKLGDPNSSSIIDSISYCRSNDADAGFSYCFSRKRARTDC